MRKNKNKFGEQEKEKRRNRMKKNLMPFIAVVFALFVMRAYADVHKANTCKQEDVQATIDAAHDGDTVMLPPGTAEWTTKTPGNVAVTVPNTKGLIIQGAGMDQTVITDATGNNYGECLLAINGMDGKTFRITGITFIGKTTKPSNTTMIAISGTCKNWRVDHCKIVDQGLGSEGIDTKGYTYGLMDHLIFINTTPVVYADENNAWERPLTLGTSNAVYIEDCQYPNAKFHWATDGRSGGRFVLRYSDMTNTQIGTHGTDGGGSRGIHSYECYANRFMAEGTVNCYRAAEIRGGTGVIFDNTYIGNWGTMTVEHNCACNFDPNDNRCGGAKFCTSYPCLDQIGRTTDMDNDHTQDLEPFYAWNNKGDGTLKYFTIAGCPDVIKSYIKENRDFYNNTPRPGYVPYPYPHFLSVLDESGRLLGLKGVENQGAVSLTWNAVKNTVKYQVRRNWGAEIVSLAATNTEYIDNAGGGYLYLVEAVDSDGTVLAAEGVMTDQEKPTVPTGLSAIPISGTQIDLKWGLSTDNLVLGGYRIYRNGELVNHNATLAYSDTNLTPNTLYTYTVTAYDAAGNESAPSESVAVTTPGSGGGGSDAGGGGGGGGGGCFISAVQGLNPWYMVWGLFTAGSVWRTRRAKAKSKKRKINEWMRNDGTGVDLRSVLRRNLRSFAAVQDDGN